MDADMEVTEEVVAMDIATKWTMMAVDMPKEATEMFVIDMEGWQ